MNERAVALAFVPPALFGIGAGVCVAAVMGIESFAHAMHEAGWFGPLAWLIALLGTGVASVVMGLGLSRPLALLAAVAPWIVAALGALYGINVVIGVLDMVGPLDRATLFGAGYSESLAARAVVAPVSAALLLGVLLAALVRARARDDERWQNFALAALALVGAGLAIASTTVAASMHSGLRMLAMLPSDDQRAVAAAMNAEAAFGRTAGLVVAALGGVALLVVVALGSARGARIGGVGIVVGALALLIAPVLDVAHEVSALRAAQQRERPWRGISEFAPIELDVGAALVTANEDVLIVAEDAVVLGHDRVMAVSSTNATSHDVRAYVTALARKSPHTSPQGPSTLRVAFDARAPAALVAAILGVARDAEVELIEIVGVAPGGAVPGIVGRAAPTLARPVLLGCARAQANPRLGDVNAPDKITCIDARGASAAELARRLPDVRAETVALALDAADAVQVQARPLE